LTRAWTSNLKPLTLGDKMIYKDERTNKEAIKTHRNIVGGTYWFKVSIGVGGLREHDPSGGVARYAWACTDASLAKVRSWVARRHYVDEIEVSNVVFQERGADFVHVYVVRKGHPAFVKA